jgi:hypothetical protein
MIQIAPVAQRVAASVTQSTHTIAALIGFQSQLEACVVLNSENIVGLPSSLEEIYKLWNEAHRQSKKPPKHRGNCGLPTTRSLPPQLQQYEQDVKSRPTFKRHYPDQALYRVTLVPVCHLITPQWYADLDYIAAIRRNIPQPGDLEEALELVFKEEDAIAAPSIATQGNISIATFQRPARNLLVGLPEIDSTNSHKTKVVWPVETRANYLQVCEIEGQFVIVNGIHRSAAFLAAGWDYIPCLLRKAKGLYEVFQLGTLGVLHEPQKLQYPPYICSLFDSAVAPRFQQVDVDQQLQIVSQWATTNIVRGLQTAAEPSPTQAQP